ncbi:MAG TPA: hypothetical protein DIW30_01815 [Bacteroidales bacterium]|nr:hypothetical protein [Bacteroidales bacterium]
MTLGDLLNTLAAKIGLQNEPALIDLLSSADLAKHDVSDALAQRFDTGLMSLDGAKNNRDVLNHLKPIILKAADDKFAILAEKYGITNEMQSEQSTYKKIDLLESALATRLADMEKKAQSNQNTKGEEAAQLTKQIAELQKQIATISATKDNELAEYKKATAKQQLDMLVNFELNGKRYANQDLGDTNIDIARALITRAMQEQRATLVNDDGKLKLKQTGNPSLDFVDSGYKPVSFSDFVNRILADKHLLEVSNDHDNNGGSDNPAPQQPTTVTLTNGKKVDTASIDAAAAAALADLE